MVRCHIPDFGTRYGDNKWRELRWGVLGRFTSYLIYVKYPFDEEERRNAYEFFLGIRECKEALRITGSMPVPGFEWKAEVSDSEDEET